MSYTQGKSDFIASISGFFKGVLDAIGIDIVLLLSILIVGISLGIVYNGANDSGTAIFCIIYTILVMVCLLAAFLAKSSDSDFFIGAEKTLVEQLSPAEHPVLGLIYLFAGFILGFVLAAGGEIFSSTVSSQAFGPANFIFQNVFSPVVEEYFFRGFLLPLFMGISLMFLMRSIDNDSAARVAAFLVANTLQAIAFAFVHLAAFSGDPSQLLGSFGFGWMMGVIVMALGLLPAIGVHSGHNGAAWINQASVPVIVNIS